MKRELKVFGLGTYINSKHVRIIVLARSMNQAHGYMEAAVGKIQKNYFYNHACASGNTVEISIATEPGQVYIAPGDIRKDAEDYKRIDPK